MEIAQIGQSLESSTGSLLSLLSATPGYSVPESRTADDTRYGEAAMEMQLTIQSLSTKTAVTVNSEITADETSTFVFSSSQKYRLILDMDLSEVLTERQRASGVFRGELSLQLHFTHPNKRTVESEEDLQYFLSRVETLVEQDSKDPELPNLRLFLHINEFEGVPVQVVDGRLSIITRIWPCIFSGTKRRTKQEDHENIEFVLTFSSLEGRVPFVARSSANVRVVPKSSYYKQKQRKAPAKGKRGLATKASGSASAPSKTGTRPLSRSQYSGRRLLSPSAGEPSSRRQQEEDVEGEATFAPVSPSEEPPMDHVAQRQLEQLQLQHLQQLQLQELQQKQEQQKAALLLSQQMQLRHSLDTVGHATGLSDDRAKDSLRLSLFARPAPKMPARSSTGNNSSSGDALLPASTGASSVASSSAVSLASPGVPSCPLSIGSSITLSRTAGPPRAGTTRHLAASSPVFASSSASSSSSSSAGPSSAPMGHLSSSIASRRPLFSAASSSSVFSGRKSPSLLSGSTPSSSLRFSRLSGGPLSQSLPTRSPSPLSDLAANSKRPRLSL